MADQKNRDQPERQSPETGTERTTDPTKRREGQRGIERDKPERSSEEIERERSGGTTRNKPEGDVEGIGETNR